MPEHEEPSAEPEIHCLLEQIQGMDETVRDLAAACLRQFRVACRKQVAWRNLAVRIGGNPEIALVRAALKIEARREELREQLAKLVAWAGCRTDGKAG